MGERSSDRCLCVFARAPTLGLVKTRLAAELGPAVALAAHTELLEGTLERCVAPADYQTELWIAGLETDNPVVAELIRRFGLGLRVQWGGDLGSRMWNALEEKLKIGVRVLVIGSDCPDIDRDYVLQGFGALDQADVVLGPAEDGGYGLIGLRAAAEELFTGVRWGSDDVVRTTLERAELGGLRVRLLKGIYDVDTLSDWQRYRDESTAS